MFKIGEFSILTQVSIRMLRYYDQTGLLKPAQIDPASGYRLYASNQIPIIGQIIFLRDLGFGTAEIKAALANWSDSYISGILDKKQKEIEDTVRTEKSKLDQIQLAQKDLRYKKIDIHYNVTVRPIPCYQVLSLRRIIPDYYAEGLLWKELSAFAAEHRIAISDQTFSIYHDLDYRETNVDVEICVPVKEIGISQGDFRFGYSEAVENMACTMVYGPFANIAGAYRSFAGWLQEHKHYEMAGKSRQIVHRGPWNEDQPENYLTEIQIPLQPI